MQLSYARRPASNRAPCEVVVVVAVVVVLLLLLVLELELASY